MSHPRITVLHRIAVGSWLLTCAANCPAQNPAATVNLDANLNRQAINPLIYGVAHASTAALNDLNSSLNRNGGNNTSRYNWNLNADNRGSDWYFESDDVSTSMQLRRNRSTRSLWDPNYVDESWINTQVRLIPRLKGWVSSYYPGTPVGLTEYNWGAEGHISGAIAQADIYGIFGREGLDMGARWATPASSTPTYKAMKLYRN